MGKQQPNNQNKEKDNLVSPKPPTTTVSQQALNMVESGSGSNVMHEEVTPGSSETAGIQKQHDIMSAVAPTKVGNTGTNKVPLDSQIQVGGSISCNEPKPGPSGSCGHDDSKKNCPLPAAVDGSTINNYNLNDDKAATKVRRTQTKSDAGKSGKRPLSPCQPGPSNVTATLEQDRNADTDSRPPKRIKMSQEQDGEQKVNQRFFNAQDGEQEVNQLVTDAQDGEQEVNQQIIDAHDGEQEVNQHFIDVQDGEQEVNEEELLALLTAILNGQIQNLNPDEQLALERNPNEPIICVLVSDEEAMDEGTPNREQLEDLLDKPIINIIEQPNNCSNNDDSDDEGNISLPF